MHSPKSSHSHHLLHLKDQDRIGWIGLGSMGQPMALNLQRYLHSRSLTMTVWNRSPQPTVKLHSHGARVAQSVEEVVAQCNIIFTSLANDAVVEEIYETLIETAGMVDHPIIFVETSTIYPGLSTKLLQRLAVYPQHTYLQCPVFGRPPAAKAAKLLWVTSGNEAAIKKLQIYFTTMSKEIIDLKTRDVAAASSLKLVGNFFVVGTLELLAEGLNLADKSGVDRSAILKFIETFFPTPSWQDYSKKMAAEKFEEEVGFTVTLGLKDVGHMQQLAKDHGAALPTADTAHKHLTMVKDAGHPNRDWSSILGAVQAQSTEVPDHSSTSDNHSEEKKA